LYGSWRGGVMGKNFQTGKKSRLERKGGGETQNKKTKENAKSRRSMIGIRSNYGQEAKRERARGGVSRRKRRGLQTTF